MLIDQYFDALQGRLDAIRSDTQPILQAARLCADALERGGVIHIFDSGHMVSQELVNRAGGLVAYSALKFQLAIDNLVKTRADLPNDSSLGYAFIQHLFLSNQLRQGDVLIVGSVSGKTPNVIELALRGKEHGLTVIGLTSVAYSSQLESEHPTGKRLFEAVDLVLDNHAPYGDAMLEVPGLEYPALPASGLGAAVTLWAMTAALIEEMLQRGKALTVYPSVNRPNGPALVNQANAEAKQKGF